MKFNLDATDETNTIEETLKPRVEFIGGTRPFLSPNLRHVYGESIVIIELLTTPQKQANEPGKKDQEITFDLYLHPYPNVNPLSYRDFMSISLQAIKQQSFQASGIT